MIRPLGDDSAPFKPIGTIKAIKAEDLVVTDYNADLDRFRAFTKPMSYSMDIPDTPENRKSFQALKESCEIASVCGMANMIREVHRRGYIRCRIEYYKEFSHLVHKHFGMNFSRYCKSIWIKNFSGFWVRLNGGTWVKKR